MTDSYQAIYDAVRSRISGGSISDAVSDAVRNALNVSHTIAILQQDFCIAAGEMARPSVVYRPSLSIDGDQWCALYGDDLMSGCAGFGPTPNAAMQDFDQNWWKQKLPRQCSPSADRKRERSEDAGIDDRPEMYSKFGMREEDLP